MPTSISKQGGNATIAVAAVLPGQFDHVGNKALFVLFAPWDVALCGAMLTKYATGTAFGNTQLVTYLINATSTTQGA